MPWKILHAGTFELLEEMIRRLSGESGPYEENGVQFFLRGTIKNLKWLGVLGDQVGVAVEVVIERYDVTDRRGSG